VKRPADLPASPVRARLPAAERRQVLIDVALHTFSAGSYRGVTTADIARAAGVSEPVLYRHFASKRDLYLACIDEAWRRLRDAWERIRADQGPAEWMALMAQSAFRELRPAKALLTSLWVQALTEASDDAEIRRYLRRHLRDVHRYVANVVRELQRLGVVIAERDPEAEAWIFMAVGLLGSVGRRLGGLVEDDFPRIVAARREWMAGVATDPEDQIKIEGI
jgi:AcrR family transcriptional regulator